MNDAANAVRISEMAKNDYLGRKIGTRVFVSCPDGMRALELRNTMMAAERLGGSKVTEIRKGQHNIWHETYSRDAGYLWGRSTGWRVVGYEVQA